MSPRSRTARPLPPPPPRRTAVTDDRSVPVDTSSGSPSIAARTVSCVRGRSSPTSGYRCSRRRSSTRSSCIVRASSRTVMRRPYGATGRMSSMRFVILGAGAVGGTIGGRLADSGHDVVLLARGEHARVMRKRGLRLAMPERVIEVRMPVVDHPSDLPLRDDDVLVLTTKTQQTAALLDALPRRDLPVVCAQNGVTNERIALRRFADVYAMVVMLPAAHMEPGRVDAQGSPYSGLLDIGRYFHGTDEVTERVAAAMSSSGFVSEPVERIMRWKYAKLLRNLG